MTGVNSRERDGALSHGHGGQLPRGVQGAADPNFTCAVRAFAQMFPYRRFGGGALAVYLDGEPVVDVWTGWSDRRGKRRWNADTAPMVFSATKGVAATVIHRLADRGLIDYDAPVAEYWPEFAARGKESVLVRHVLAHRSGLSALEHDLTVDEVLDWSTMTAALAEAAPLWQPGYSYAYHALTQGWLIGEVLQRATGLSVGELFDREVASPAEAEVWIGLPERFESRVAYLTVGDTLQQHIVDQAARLAAGEIDWSDRALTLGGAFPSALVDGDRGFNEARVHRAAIPAAGGIATARGLASIWGAVVSSDRERQLLSPQTLALASAPQSEGMPFFPQPEPWSRWGMGLQLDSAARRYLSARSVGHDGAGGQVAFADPASRVGFAFVTNRMEAIDPRGTAMIDALRHALGLSR